MNNFTLLKVKKTYIKIPFPEIQYVEAKNKYIRVVTTKGIYESLEAITEFVKRLPSLSFCQVHRSYIVSLHFIQQFDRFNVTIAGFAIPIGRQHRSSFIMKMVTLSQEASKGNQVISAEQVSMFSKQKLN